MLGVVMGIIRKFFMALDMVVYTLIQTILQLILDLSNVSIFSKTSINNFAKRIYVILGLVMVFKLMISFIQIIINPDKMTDKEQGIGNILGRVAFSLVLIVMVPSIFDLAREIQGYILPVIPKVILGAETTVDVSDPNQMDSVARDMTLYSFLPFFTYDNSSCNEGQILGTGTSDQIGNLEVYDMGSAFYNVNNEADCSTSEFGYRYKYSFFISTLVGAYEVFVLVQIAVSIAIRAIKLSICEFVAPIPIASYIDPKSSKQTFSKWVSTTLKTYADLFVRLIILYFVIFVFMTIFKTENIAIITKNLGGSVVRTSLVILFIIVGLLQFVKSAPKFISDLLGIPEGGGDIMGMFKGEGLGAFRDATAIPGTALAALGSAVGNARYASKNGEKGHTIARRAVGGFFGATRRGMVSTLKGEGWQGAYTNNVQTTTGISQRKVNARLMARQSKDEYDKIVGRYNKEYNDAVNEINNNSSLSASQKHDAIAAAKNNRDRNIARVPKPIEPFRDNVKNAFNRWQGMSSPTGSTYSSAASTLASWREKYYTGEAMKKLIEQGSLLDTVSHGGYFDDNNKEATFNFSQLRQAYNDLQNGRYTGKIGDFNINSSRLEEMYNRAQKLGAEDYILATTRGLTDDYGNTITIENATMTEMDKQVRGMIEGLGIENGLKQELLNEYSANPGSFFKNLSDITKQLETSGSRRSSYEQNQEKKN